MTPPPQPVSLPVATPLPPYSTGLTPRVVAFLDGSAELAPPETRHEFEICDWISQFATDRGASLEHPLLFPSLAFEGLLHESSQRPRGPEHALRHPLHLPPQ